MKNKKIEVVKNWLELKLVWDIQVFITFANFYQCFICDFSKIVILLTLIFKTTRLSKILASRAFEIDSNEVIIGSNDGRADKTLKNFSKYKKLKNTKF